MASILKPKSSARSRAEGDIELFLRLFPLLAGHFELKSDLQRGIIGFFSDTARVIAKEYEEALDDEKQGDKRFVASLPCALTSPKVKRPIIND